MKRRWSTVLVLFAVLSLILTACGVPGVSAPAESKAELRIAVPALAGKTWDPIVDSSAAVAQLELIYDWLVGYDKLAKEVSTKTGLAEKWDRPDPTTWVFYLRDGPKFQNGDKVTAADVKFSLDRVLGEKSASSFGAALRGLIDRVEAVNPNQVLIHTRVPAFTLPLSLSPLAGLEGIVLPKDYLTQNGDKILTTKPIGSGPYRVAEYEPGNRLVLETAGEHFGTGTPKYSRVSWSVVPEEATRLSMLRQGSADMASVSTGSIPGLKDAGLGVRLKQEAFVASITFRQQWKKESAFSDERVRQALTLAVNRQQVASTIMQGTADASLGNYMARQGIGFKAYDPIPYDPERAKTLLRDAGYATGLVVNLYTYPREQLPEARSIADAIAGYWNSVGVQTKIIQQDYGTVRDMMNKGTLQDPAVTGPQDIGSLQQYDSIFGLTFASTGTTTAAKDPVLDGLIQDLAKNGLTDADAYASRAQRVDEYVTKHSILSPLFHGSTAVAASPKIPEWDLGKAQFGINLRGLVGR